jgi:hypothetical protein
MRFDLIDYVGVANHSPTAFSVKLTQHFEKLGAVLRFIFVM